MSNTGQDEDELRELLTEAICDDLPNGAEKRVMERLNEAKLAAQTGPIDIAAWKIPPARPITEEGDADEAGGDEADDGDD